MPNRAESSPGRYAAMSVLAVGILLVVTIGYRIAASQHPSLVNTAPVMAIAFGGGMLLGRKFWWVPPLLLASSDFFLGLWHGGGGIGLYTLFSIAFYIGVALLGAWIGESGGRWLALWSGTMACSLIFYLAANTYSFLLWPGYEKSLAGWVQAQTTGVPGVNPPALFFLRNALLAGTAWCGLAFLFAWSESRWFRKEAGAGAAG